MSSNNSQKLSYNKSVDRTQKELNEKWKQITEQEENLSVSIINSKQIQKQNINLDQKNLAKITKIHNTLQQNQTKINDEQFDIVNQDKKKGFYQSPNIKKSRILFPNLFKSSPKKNNKNTKSQSKNIQEESKQSLDIYNKKLSQNEQNENELKDEKKCQNNLELNLVQLQNFLDLNEQNRILIEYRQNRYEESDQSDNHSNENKETYKNQNFTEIEYNSTSGNQILTTGQQSIKNTAKQFSNTQFGTQGDFFFLNQDVKFKRKTQQHIRKSKKRKNDPDKQEELKQKNALGFLTKFLPNWQSKKKDQKNKKNEKQQNDCQNDETLQVHMKNYIRNDENQFQIIENYIIDGDENIGKNNVSNNDNLSTKLFIDAASQLNNENQVEFINKKKRLSDDDFDLQYQGFGEILYNSSDSDLDIKKRNFDYKNSMIQQKQSEDTQSRYSLVAMRKQKQIVNYGGTFYQDSQNDNGIQNNIIDCNQILNNQLNQDQIQQEDRKLSLLLNQNQDVNGIQENQALQQNIIKNKRLSEYSDEFQNDGDLPINLDFLNQQEQQIVDNLFPQKQKKSDNSNTSIIKSGNQLSYSRMNLDQETIFNKSLSQNNQESKFLNLLPADKLNDERKQKSQNNQKQINENEIIKYFKGIKVQQQGTSISIFNIWDSDQKQKILQILNDNHIIPIRVIDLQQCGEIILNMLSFEETSLAIKFFIDNQVKIISNQMINQSICQSNIIKNENLNQDIQKLIENQEKNEEERDMVYEISLNLKNMHLNEKTENINSFKNSSERKSPDKILKNSFNSIYSSQMQLKNNLMDSGTIDERYRMHPELTDQFDHHQQLSFPNIQLSSQYPFGQLDNLNNEKAQRTTSQQEITQENKFLVKIADISEKNQSYFEYVKAKFQQERQNRIDKNEKLNDDQKELSFKLNDSNDPRLFYMNMASNYANYEGLMSQSQINFVYENSLNTKNCKDVVQSQQDTRIKKNFINKSADYQQSIKPESQFDSESSEKFSYIQPLVQQNSSYNFNLFQNKMNSNIGFESLKQRQENQDSFNQDVTQSMLYLQQQNWQQEQMYFNMFQNQQIQLGQNYQIQQKQIQKNYGRNINEVMKYEQPYNQIPQQYSQYHEINAQLQQKNFNQINFLQQQQIQQHNLQWQENEKLPQASKQLQENQNTVSNKQNMNQSEQIDQKKNLRQIIENNEDDIKKVKSESPIGQKKQGISNYKKKIYIGPKESKIDFDRILNASQNDDLEVQQQTTLMIRNIPIKFNQQDMMQLIDKNFQGQYDYFYLPIDLKTQCGMGFAFINMLDSIFILEFYLEFNCIKWSEKIEKCNSNKHCLITYANVQGINDIKAELLDKNIMKKTDEKNKPQFFEDFQIDQEKISEIKNKYKYDYQYIDIYQSKLKQFEEFNNTEIQNQKQKQGKNEKQIKEEQKSENDNSLNDQYTQVQNKKQLKKEYSQKLKQQKDYDNQQFTESNYQQKQYGKKQFFQRNIEYNNPNIMNQQQNFNREIFFDSGYQRNKSAFRKQTNNEIQYSLKYKQNFKYEDQNGNEKKNLQSYQQILLQKNSQKFNNYQKQKKEQDLGDIIKGKNFYHNPIHQIQKNKLKIFEQFEFQHVEQIQLKMEDLPDYKVQLTPTFKQLKNHDIKSKLQETIKNQNQYLYQIFQTTKIQTGITPVQPLKQPSNFSEYIFKFGKLF